MKALVAIVFIVALGIVSFVFVRGHISASTTRHVASLDVSQYMGNNCAGRSCAGNLDCGMGCYCHKGYGQLYGTCVSR